jgi:hypothetical protein
MEWRDPVRKCQYGDSHDEDLAMNTVPEKAAETKSEEPVPPYILLSQLAPADYCDPVVEVYKRDIDRSLLRENLKLTPDERSRKFERNMRMVSELRRAAETPKSE